ncbi:hypothetical protein AVEN_85618-1 [Araneus ventricosus]|uniref:Uncharacterized protein n=1 Tax=Araneus ventricosus TaxID=182803 RepID=A0A4Y2WBG4_ARAVE|nr:hypothetical protein AVEN_85618-1 [Araneus ventricosus]
MKEIRVVFGVTCRRHPSLRLEARSSITFGVYRITLLYERYSETCSSLSSDDGHHIIIGDTRESNLRSSGQDEYSLPQDNHSARFECKNLT